jgi:hypothetical protein
MIIMEKEVIILVDYKNNFGSKYNAFPYNSGMELSKISSYFNLHGYNAKIFPFYKVDFRKEDYRGKIVIYTSSEDDKLSYKDYIEDIIYGLELCGAILIPPFKFLRANNNKVFMEIIRNLIPDDRINSIHSNFYGTYEEMFNHNKFEEFSYPLVIKPAAGAMSKGVTLAINLQQIIKQIKRLSRTKNYFRELWEQGRSFKYRGYMKNSKYRKKFIVQNFIPDLENDWKVLVFGKKYYVLKRKNRKNDFRASGGGLLSYSPEINEGLLNYAKSVFDILGLPHVSIDIAFDGKNYHLFEFQAIYFGSYTLTYSEFYFINENDQWQIVYKKSELEKEYVDSIITFINNKRFNSI